MTDNPMNRAYVMHRSPRCTATSKLTLVRCQAPAVTGWTVCRFHGAGGGAPKGKRNGAFRHGLHTLQAMAERDRLTVKTSKIPSPWRCSSPTAMPSRSWRGRDWGRCAIVIPVTYFGRLSFGPARLLISAHVISDPEAPGVWAARSA
jgi:hypothetical protein